jgi:hypothetical protein
MIREPDATLQPAPQDIQLMSKHRVLRFKPELRLEWRGQDGQNETEQPDHSASLGDSITSSTRIRFSVHTGPIVIEIEYRVDSGSARTFYGLMQQVQLNRQRNGAYGWSIARDITNPELWTERYHCPTWHDYLRQRSRPTQSERALQKSAAAFHLGPESVRIRRMLERPFGSVRWKEESPDRIAADIISISTPSTSGT